MANFLSFAVLVLRVTCALGADGQVEPNNVCPADGDCDTRATSASRPDDGGQELINWIRSLGGFVNPGLRVGPLDPDDASSPFGVFTNVSLLKGTVLLRVPWQVIVKPDVGNNDANERFCSTVEVVERELSLGNQSVFAPYMRYVLAHNPVLEVPCLWSPVGRTLLQMVIGSGTRATDVGSVSAPLQMILAYCGFLSPQEQATALRVYTRHTRELLIPLLDMMNHGNGHKHNIKMNLRHGKAMRVLASRDIEAGEEICDSYNDCTECGDRYEWYGTSEIFFDFGFLEPMPQVWHFLWDLHIKLDGTASNHSEIHASSVGEVTLKDENLAWTEREVDRLNHVGPMLLKFHGSVPQHEWSAILQYHSALSLALSKTVEVLAETTTHQ